MRFGADGEETIGNDDDSTIGRAPTVFNYLPVARGCRRNYHHRYGSTAAVCCDGAQMAVFERRERRRGYDYEHDYDDDDDDDNKRRCNGQTTRDRQMIDDPTLRARSGIDNFLHNRWKRRDFAIFHRSRFVFVIDMRNGVRIDFAYVVFVDRHR